VSRSSGMTCHWIRPNVRHIGILLPVSISTISLQSTCHSAPLQNFYTNRTAHSRKMTCRFSRWQIYAILNFRGPMMGSLKSPCTTSYRSSIDTIALINCLVFEKIAFLEFGERQTSKQTDKQTRRWAGPSHEASLAVANGGLII